MSHKPWQERPLWERVWLGPNSKVYLHAGYLIHHTGCNAFSFWDRAKLLPGYDKLKFDNAMRDLTVYAKREQGQYELHAAAKKTLRIIIGPAPDDPEYVAWWRGRLISVRLEREAGRTVSWAESPPVPLPGEEPVEDPKPAKKPAPKKKPAKQAKRKKAG